MDHEHWTMDFGLWTLDHGLSTLDLDHMIVLSAKVNVLSGLT